MDSQSNTARHNYILLFIIVCIIILIITWGYFKCLTHFDIITLKLNEKHGLFGDMFGGLNALFSGLAFAGVIITIIMQMKELELTREELRKSSKAQDESQKALNNQLNHMQATSKIELANSAIKIYSDKNEDDKVEIAKAIFERMTKNLFENIEFIDIVKPQIEFKDFRINGQDDDYTHYLPKSTAYDINKKNKIKIDFFSLGANFNFYIKDKKDFKFDLIKVDPIPNSSKRKYNQISLDGALIERNYNYILTINNVLNQESIIISLKYVGEFIKHEFEQTLKFDIKNRKGNKIDPEISEITHHEIQNQLIDP